MLVITASYAKKMYRETGGSPFEANPLAQYKPYTVASRIVSQGGLFTIHPKPAIPLEESKEPRGTLPC